MGSSPAKRAFDPVALREPPAPPPHPAPRGLPRTTRRGRLAQLVRASVLHTEGRRFEPVIAHHRPFQGSGEMGGGAAR